MKNKILNPSNSNILSYLTSLTILLGCFTACSNTQINRTRYKTNPNTAIELKKMNVLYLGIENPVKIVTSDYSPKELSINIDNGKISTITNTGEYIIRPDKIGSANLKITFNNKIIREAKFRVKRINTPVAAIQYDTTYKTGGKISKNELIKAEKLSAVIRDFDYDLSFEIVSFNIKTTLPNSDKTLNERTMSSFFSESQIKLINSLKNGHKLTINEIKAKGPDGVPRNLSSINFKIIE